MDDDDEEDDEVLLVLEVAVWRSDIIEDSVSYICVFCMINSI